MLYHFSEEAHIDVFVPRAKQNQPDVPAVVWAIDEQHEYSYYFPRDCPRIVLRRNVEISDEHQDLFFKYTDADIIVTVESEWYSRIVNQTLHRYHFPEISFRLFDETAGYYISDQVITPSCIERIDHLMDRLIARGVELRLTTNLYPLRDAVLKSDFQDFGIHRFNHAKQP
ncbi:hypothetical protein HUB98_28715 [Paenibacillus barcinonensis]|uniref:Uncharacterized protein n=1 Tax=Paenibacillus barcinonensis TaxID=198119 RepID=A0A2V4VKV0_PAEBA|nr:DUF6886 family protein [Paenibacillus barcinonensis]PYE50055.1 hypothetical protein DFQ00_10413 [Paenibacillus barcinonensis]QKS59797.1 hypothetical protein HUB98_28715 [Paenibacillus barcinonensis]